MKKIDTYNEVKWIVRVLILLFTIHCSLFTVHAQGIPFIRNFNADEYHANNMNFDVVSDENGIIFVANFEGLMYYDYATWRMLKTPGITRVTVCVRTSDNTLWVGGYNYFGKVSRKPNGELYLERVASPDLFVGEVLEIFEKDGEVLFAVSNGNVYCIKDGKISVKTTIDKESVRVGVTDVVDVEAIMNNEKDVILTDVIKEIPIGNGLNVLAKNTDGIALANDEGQTLYTVKEENGLCSNSMSYIGYNDRGLLWGATDKGVFAIQVPSAFSHFTEQEGLVGVVSTIGKLGDKIYVGTDEGLFRLDGRRFVKIAAIKYACWDLKTNARGMFAATSDGIFFFTKDGGMRQLTNGNTLALLNDGDVLYASEVTGIYKYNVSGQNRQLVCDLTKTKRILKDKEGTVWLQNLYGEIWYKKANTPQFLKYKTSENAMSTIVEIDGTIKVVSSENDKPFPYPLFSCADTSGVTWLTNNLGKNLYRWKDGKRLTDMNLLLSPIQDVAIRAIFRQGDEIWLGNDDGVIVINPKAPDAIRDYKPRLFIRSVILGSDSVLWGGFGDMPDNLPDLGSGNNDLHFTYSIDAPSIAGNTLYRYRMNNDKWTAWSTNCQATFSNLPDGNYTFHVEARDAMNRTTEITSISFYIAPPFYKRWYMYVVYFIVAAAIIYLLFRLRLQRLEKDKQRLEKVVKERTAEVVKQKDEIEEKSNRLETALTELGEAQHELIRQEKMATVGKLTQGLIDRILNPLNYINNFSKLSEGLIKDVKANIEDEKEHMSEDNYEDTVDVLDMLTGNLKKVSEHGQNTTRTLKAMEEMLKDRSGGIVPMDLANVIHQNEEMLKEYFKKEIAEHHIKTVFTLQEEHLNIDGNAEQLSKTIMCILGNAVYAVVKKAQNTSYDPEIALQAKMDDNAVKISIRDNGIGIEDTITNKIFDPFFTTKTTGEAAGVGLYLSREIVQNHGGDISVQSVKNEYTEFIITLPYKNA